MQTGEQPYVPLEPKECGLLIVDPLSSLLAHLEADVRDQLAARMQIVLDLCDKLSIPVVVSVVGEEQELFPSYLSMRDSVTILPRSCINPYDDPALYEMLLGKLRPPFLIMIGYWAEMSLATTVFAAYRNGHEVFVPLDLCPGLEAPALKPKYDLMIRYGVDLMTWRQLIVEWARHSRGILDDGLLQTLLEDTPNADTMLAHLRTDG